MDVAIVGPGRLGTLLAVACARSGHRVRAVAGGSEAARRRVADLVAGVRPIAELEGLAGRAELFVLAVPDDAIGEVERALVSSTVVTEGTRVVHVAGSRGVDALRLSGRAGAQVAACHPAMTVPSGQHDPQVLVGVAWAVSASAASRGWAEAFVRDLGGDPHAVPDDRRALYHAALATASNAVASAAVLARALLLAAKVERPGDFLAPLAAASLDNALAAGASALTGPVVRGDTSTVAGHLEALERDTPHLSAVYRHHTAALLAQVAPHLDAAVVAELAALLDPGPPAGPDRHAAVETPTMPRDGAS